MQYSGNFGGSGTLTAGSETATVTVSGILTATISQNASSQTNVTGTWTYSGNAYVVPANPLFPPFNEPVDGNGAIGGTLQNLTITVLSGDLANLTGTISDDGTVIMGGGVADTGFGGVNVAGQVTGLPPVVQFQHASLQVNEDGAVLLALQRSFISDVWTTVHVNSDETLSATVGSDFVRVDQDIMFPPGVTAANVTLNILPDTIIEANELVTVRVTPVRFANIGATPTIQVTILDDDQPAPPIGTPGNDTLDSGPGDDVINADAGDDTINWSPGSGNDIVDGGPGTDTVVINLAQGVANTITVLRNGDGTVQITGGGGVQFTMRVDNVENLRFEGRDGNDVITIGDLSGTDVQSTTVFAGGDAGNDKIDGTLLDKRLVADGGPGQDTLIGGLANDNLTGGTGADTLNGGLGRDTAVFSGIRAAYTVTRSGSTVTVSGPEGPDTLSSIEVLKFDDGIRLISTSNDFNADGRSDVLFSNQGAVYNSNYEWQLDNRSLLNEHAIDLYDKSFTVQVVGDFDGDGKSDLLFQNPVLGGVWQWRLDGSTILSQGAVDVGDPSYHLLGTADFNGDGRDDVLFRNDAGFVYQWQMDGLDNTPKPVSALDPKWHVVGAGDFNGDGKADLLLRNIGGSANENGAFFLWQMDGNAIAGGGGVERPPTAWKTLGVGDFDGDGKDDFAVRNVSNTADNGAVWVYLMNGTAIKAQGAAGIADAATWELQQIADLNGDGRDDILFRNLSGFFYSWNMDGTTIASEGLLEGAAQWAPVSFQVVTQHWDVV